MTQTITTVRMRFAVGAQDSTEALVNGSVAGFLFMFPVAATLKVQVQIDSNLAGYDLHTDAGLFDAAITGNTDTQCIMLPEPIALTGARLRIRSTVTATAVVDCFALVINN